VRRFSKLNTVEPAKIYVLVACPCLPGLPKKVSRYGQTVDWFQTKTKCLTSRFIFKKSWNNGLKFKGKTMEKFCGCVRLQVNEFDIFQMLEQNQIISNLVLCFMLLLVFS
jgi:hypothetical protein